MAFEDRKPASQYHYLVIPKRHIGRILALALCSLINDFSESVRSLKQPDIELGKALLFLYYFVGLIS